MRTRNGDGTIFRRGSKFNAQITIGYHPDGRRIRRTKTRTTYTEAQKALGELRDLARQGIVTATGNPTFRDFAHQWLTLYASNTCKATTITGYRDLLNRYAFGYIGSVRLLDLRAEHIAQLLAQLKLSELSVSTRKQIRAIIRRILQSAFEQRIIPVNVAEFVPVPRKDNPDEPTAVREPLTKQESLTLLDLLSGSELHDIVALAIFTGMRRGEITGLKWSDIDSNEQTLTVRRTLKEARVAKPDGTYKTKIITDTPKTRNSRRTLPIGPTISRTLNSARTRQIKQRLGAGSAWLETDFVFTTPIGTPINPNGVSKKLRSTLKRLNLRHIRFHDLRHTCATLMLEAEAPLEEVSQALGHATITITKDIYAPYVQPLATRAIQRLDTHLAVQSVPPLKRVATNNTSNPRHDTPKGWIHDN